MKFLETICVLFPDWATAIGSEISAPADRTQGTTVSVHLRNLYWKLEFSSSISEQHIQNYHKNGQIPQLIEYVCGKEHKKTKKTTKKTSS
ncbi:hypothetical protein COOONC_20204 [Cooperia oncophora]